MDDAYPVAFGWNFSVTHVLTAAFFAKRAGDLETQFRNTEYDDSIMDQHLAFVTGSIVASVFFLEAGINETFSDCAGEFIITPTIFVEQLTQKTRELMGELWRSPGFGRSSILEKYETALKLASKKQFSKDDSLRQDVQIIISLRNYLAHYKPERILSTFYGFEGDDRAGLGKQLAKKKFELNPFISDDYPPFFPHKCLGYGLAKWCVSGSVRFADEFHKRMGIPPRYENVRNEVLAV